MNQSQPNSRSEASKHVQNQTAACAAMAVDKGGGSIAGEYLNTVTDDPVRGASAGDEQAAVLCDAAQGRVALLSNLIREVGGVPYVLAPGAVFLGQQQNWTGVVLVALGNAWAQNNPAFDIIARYKRSGCLIIAYEDGANQWPVRYKCRPLLAGATKLLDSSGPGFVADLRQFLEQEFRARVSTHRDAEHIRSLMHQFGIIGESPAMIDGFRLAMRFSQFSDLPVLITGESGTGKELLAKAIARMDPKRKDGPFVGINCAAVQPNLLESEFFGHRRGAFTGADRDRKGWIRAAQGGVLFLDEIGELDMSLQAKLLRVLQENRVLGVGEEEDVPVSVRFIAATNRNLEELVAQRSFRADLLHRLRVLFIHMPPLRDRPEDLPLLIEHIVQKQRSLQSTGATGVTPDFLDALRQLDLPGNVRQLENLVRQSLIAHQRQGELDLGDLPADVLAQVTGRFEQNTPVQPGDNRSPGSHGGQVSPESMDEFVKRILESQGWRMSSTLRECERCVIHVALQRAAGNQSQAARLLGITPRCVYNMLRKHHIQA